MISEEFDKVKAGDILRIKSEEELGKMYDDIQLHPDCVRRLFGTTVKVVRVWDRYAIVEGSDAIWTQEDFEEIVYSPSRRYLV